MTYRHTRPTGSTMHPPRAIGYVRRRSHHKLCSARCVARIVFLLASAISEDGDDVELDFYVVLDLVDGGLVRFELGCLATAEVSE